MSASEQIDHYISLLPDWKKDLISLLRRYIHEVDPEVIEEWKWGSPVFSHNGMIIALAAFSDHIKVNFFQGAAIPDVNGLFNAGLESKKTRAIDIHKNNTFDENKFKALLKIAIMHNTNIE